MFFMEQPSIVEEKPKITIGALGADGAGKTRLSTAITQHLAQHNGRVIVGGEMCMRSRSCTEEDGDPSEFETESRRYQLIDCRRHFDVLENLIANWIPLHGAILVVSALDGITAQTRMQITLAQTVGVAAIVVCITKCDLVEDPELLDVVKLEIQTLLADNGYGSDAPILCGNARISDVNASASWSNPIKELLDALDRIIPPPDLENLPFLMPIEDAFGITGRGAIATGRVERGRLVNGEPIEIVGMGPSRTVIAAEMEQFGSSQSRIQRGDNAGILLRDMPRTEVQRGQVLATPGTMQAYTRFRAALYLFPPGGGARGTIKGSDIYDLPVGRYDFFLRTTDIPGNLQWDATVGFVNGGDIIDITVTLETEVALEPSLRFVLRTGGHTLALGVVAEILG